MRFREAFTLPKIDLAAIVQPYAKYATVFAQIGSDIPLLGSFHDVFLREISRVYLRSVICIKHFVTANSIRIKRLHF